MLPIDLLTASHKEESVETQKLSYVQTCYHSMIPQVCFPFTKFKPYRLRGLLSSWALAPSLNDTFCRQRRGASRYDFPRKTLASLSRTTSSFLQSFLSCPFPPCVVCACKRAIETKLAEPFASHKALSALGRWTFLQFLRLYAYVSG